MQSEIFAHWYHGDIFSGNESNMGIASEKKAEFHQIIDVWSFEATKLSDSALEIENSYQ